MSVREPWFSALRANLRYLGVVTRHKWFVFIAGRRVGVSLGRLLIHDLSKFGRAEWSPYVRRFIIGRAGVTDKDGDPDDFHRAWAHHWHRNPHHWEHWLRLDDGGTKPMAMPDKFVREMVADWMGAGRAYTGQWDASEWYAKNRGRIVLHDDARTLAEALLSRAAVSQPDPRS